MNRIVGLFAGMALAVFGAEARAAMPTAALAVAPAAATKEALPVVKVASPQKRVVRRGGAWRGGAWRGGSRRAARVYRGGRWAGARTARTARVYRGGRYAGRAYRGGRWYPRARYAYGRRWGYGRWGCGGWGCNGWGWGWGAAGLGVGLVTGAAIGAAYAAPPAVVVDTQTGWLEPWTSAWYESCSARYRSFNPNTGYYVAYSGRRIFCR